jgi:hypothetical protein
MCPQKIKTMFKCVYKLSFSMNLYSECSYSRLLFHCYIHSCKRLLVSQLKLLMLEASGSSVLSLTFTSCMQLVKVGLMVLP